MAVPAALCTALVLGGGTATAGAGWTTQDRDERTTEAPAGEPTTYEQTVVCVDERDDVKPVRKGVSAAQRSLRFTSLSDLSLGQGVTVAVIDTGVNPTAALGERLVAAGDIIDPDADDAGLRDCDGHGTLVAGIIAARADTRTGFRGVAPQARVLSYRQSSEAYKVAGADRDGVGTTSGLVRAIDAVVEQGADVINISSGYCGPAGTAIDPDLVAAVDRAVAADVVVVAAAGNLDEGDCAQRQGVDPAADLAATPANIPSALTVGAVLEDGEPADFSLTGEWVDVAAPGAGIISVNPLPGSEGQVAQMATVDGVMPIQGTSFAAPYVSGVVALVRARFPDLDAEQVVRRVSLTATHPAGPEGRTDAVGFGVVNPRRALTAVLPIESSRSVPEQAGLEEQMEPLRPPVPEQGTAPALLGGGSLLLLTAVVLLGRRLRRAEPPER